MIKRLVMWSLFFTLVGAAPTQASPIDSKPTCTPLFEGRDPCLLRGEHVDPQGQRWRAFECEGSGAFLFVPVRGGASHPQPFDAPLGKDERKL